MERNSWDHFLISMYIYTIRNQVQKLIVLAQSTCADMMVHVKPFIAKLHARSTTCSLIAIRKA